MSHTEARNRRAALAGDAAAAEQSLRRGYQALEQIGERNLLSTTVALLAQALLAQQRDEEAERLAEESERLADEDDLITQRFRRSIHGLGRWPPSGRVEEAERLARQAVALSEQSDFINDRADATPCPRDRPPAGRPPRRCPIRPDRGTEALTVRRRGTKSPLLR